MDTASKISASVTINGLELLVKRLLVQMIAVTTEFVLKVNATVNLDSQEEAVQ